MRITSIRLLLALGFVSMMMFVTGAGQPAIAQEDELFTLNVVSHICASDPGVLGFGTDPAAYDEAGCESVGGLSYVVTDLDGNQIGSCAETSVPPGCQLMIPYGVDVEVTQLSDGLAAGYAPRENPLFINVPDAPVTGEAPIAIFVNLPEDDGGEVTTLPSTGVGPNNPDAQVAHWIFVIGAALLAFANIVRATAMTESHSRRKR